MTLLRKLLPLAVLFSGCAAGDDTQVADATANQAKATAPLSDTPTDEVVRNINERGEGTEKIIGANDLTPVVKDGANVPEQYRQYVDAYGVISMGCTATHIGDGLVLTAGHCFGAGETEQRNVACSDTVQWGVRKDKAAYLTSKCQRVLAMRQSDNADYAIFVVSPIPPVSVPVNVDSRPSINSSITIFGHPQLRPLEWSKTCTVRPASDGGWGQNQFAHQCDTEPGSSGSTVTTAGSNTVIGIHDGGDSKWNYATYLADTPLREFIGGGNGGGDTGGGSDDRPQNYSFSDFGNNQDRVLAKLGNRGETVTFQLKSNTESGYDFVIVTDGSGNTWQQSGVANRIYGNESARLSAPVTIRFKSDTSVYSTAVDVLEISYR